MVYRLRRVALAGTHLLSFGANGTDARPAQLLFACRHHRPTVPETPGPDAGKIVPPSYGFLFLPQTLGRRGAYIVTQRTSNHLG